MTEAQQLKLLLNNSLQNNFTQRRKDLSKYVEKMNVYINKARIIHNKTMNKKKKNLINTLETMKEQVFKQSQKNRLIQKYFSENCEKILQDDIIKWDCYKDFFRKLFEFYDIRIKQKIIQVQLQKKEILKKVQQLKQTVQNSRKKNTIQQLSYKIISEKKQTKLRTQSKNKKTIQTEDSQSRVKRFKTQMSHPSIPYIIRAKIMLYRSQSNKKNNIKSRKILKDCNSPKITYDLLQMLVWYRENKQNQYNWFEKLIFGDWNFRKIVNKMNGK